MNEEHKNCKYRFKGKSCEDCPLNCKVKRLQEENEEVKEKKDEYYLRTLDYEAKISYLIQALENIRKAVGEKYGLADIIKIRTILEEVLNES